MIRLYYEIFAWTFLFSGWICCDRPGGSNRHFGDAAIITNSSYRRTGASKTKSDHRNSIDRNNKLPRHLAGIR